MLSDGFCLVTVYSERCSCVTVLHKARWAPQLDLLIITDQTPSLLTDGSWGDTGSRESDGTSGGHGHAQGV